MRALGALPRDLVITFVDGQSAFCRPPALAVVDRLRRLPIDDHTVVLTAAFLTSLWSKAALFGSLHGHWHNQTGLPQGGALSTALFNLVTLDAYEQLHDANLGISIGEFICPANAYVDDIVLFAPNEALAQSALGIVSLWAAGIRMQLNIGKEKTARLRCLGAATTALSISGQQLPEVSTYRYLGGLIHWKGSNKPLLDDLEIRLRQKTGQFLRWAHARQIPMSVLGQLWVIYVQPIALWTLAATHLTLPDKSRVDLIQKKIGTHDLGSFQTVTNAVSTAIAWLDAVVSHPTSLAGGFTVADNVKTTFSAIYPLLWGMQNSRYLVFSSSEWSRVFDRVFLYSPKICTWSTSPESFGVGAPSTKCVADWCGVCSCLYVSFSSWWGVCKLKQWDVPSCHVWTPKQSSGRSQAPHSSIDRRARLACWWQGSQFRR